MKNRNPRWLNWLGALSLCAALVLGHAHAEEAGRIDIQRVLPNGQLTREIPAGEPVTLRVSGIWHDACLPAVSGFERSGQGRLLNLFWNRALLIACPQVLTPFSLDVRNVRFEQSEIGVLPVTVLNTVAALPPGEVCGDCRVQYVLQGATVLPSIELAIQAPPAQQVAHWPTAQQPPAGLHALTPLREISGGWYSPQHSGSGLMLQHRRKASGSSKSDELWGTWANFGSDGKTQWHLLADSYWQTPTRALGKVYRAEAEAQACTLQFPNPACHFAARSARRVDPVGIFQLEVLGPDEMILTIDDSGTTLLLGLMQPPVEGYQVRLRRL
ncbi:MAG: hypothetical protein MUE46_13040 [Xanthomonadales bacterium]|jgi:hypothetical protein|nr:hypothetical protein [Xanthomonadales bacterium]